MWSLLKILVLAVASLAIGMAAFRLGDRDGADPRVPAASEGAATEVLATVGAETILQNDVEAEYDLYLADISRGDLSLNASEPSRPKRNEPDLFLLKKLIFNELLEREALYDELAADSRVDMRTSPLAEGCARMWEQVSAKNVDIIRRYDRERLRRSLCKREVVRNYFEERLAPKISFTDGELLNHYESQFTPKAGKGKELVLVRQIVLSSHVDADAALQILTPENFAKHAKSLSTTPEGAAGGMLPPYAQGQLPAVFDLAFSMTEGQISTVQESPYGFHILMLEKKLPVERPAFADVRGAVEKQLRETKKIEAYAEWLQRALKRVKIEAKGHPS